MRARYVVERLLPKPLLAPRSVGRIWIKVAKVQRRVVAERIAIGARIDTPNAFVRIREA